MKAYVKKTRNAKLGVSWMGPFGVMQRKGNVEFGKLPGGVEVLHIDEVKAPIFPGGKESAIYSGRGSDVPDKHETIRDG